MINLKIKAIKDLLQSSVYGDIFIKYYDDTDKLFICITQNNIKYNVVYTNFTDICHVGCDNKTIVNDILNKYRRYIISVYLR